MKCSALHRNVPATCVLTCAPCQHHLHAEHHQCAGPRVLIRPFFQQGQPLDMQLYLSTSSVIPDKLLWSEELVPLAGKDFSELHSVTLTRDDLSPVRPSPLLACILLRFVYVKITLLLSHAVHHHSASLDCRHWIETSQCT